MVRAKTAIQKKPLTLAALCALLAGLCACGQRHPAPAPSAPAPSAPASASVSLPRTSFLQRRAVQPACEPAMDPGGRVLVEGQDTGLTISPPKGQALPELATWALDAGSVLVATRTHWEAPGGPAPSGELWRVTCGPTPSHESFLQQPGADFGHAAQTHDGQWLYYSSPEGVAALKLETREHNLVTVHQPMPQSCATDPEAPPPQGRDVVVGWQRSQTRLVFRRGGPCGGEGLWRSHLVYLERPMDPKRRHEHTPQQIASVAAAPDGQTVWLADAGPCDLPGLLAPQSPGVVWHSGDQGATWQQRPVHDGRFPMRTAAAAVFTDYKDKDRVLVYSARCREGKQIKGGTVFLSSDQGRTWSRLNQPPNWRNRSTGQRLHGVQVPGGSLDHIIIWTTPRGRHQTLDGGKTWEKLEEPAQPPAPPTFARQGDWILRATQDGLERKSTTARTLERTFPPTVVEQPAHDK
jgi:hypothetical protein